jgi:SNF2 family DNA or RNA helicase
VFLRARGMRFVRLDGSTAVRERQALIDRFTNDTDIFVFLLSTKVRCFCSAVRCF